jgi:hypothetical protein
VKKFPLKIAILWIVAAIAMNLASAVDSIPVDGVLIYGRIHEVSVAGIRDAIKASTDLAEGGKPRALQVINSREMRAYLPKPDFGYVKVQLLMTHELDGREDLRWWTEGLDIRDTPEALRLIREANQVYVFPVKNSWTPKRDDKHMRLLEERARKELVRLLGHKSDWIEGNYSLVSLEPVRGVGFVFRRGKDEAVLFFEGAVAEGTLKGRNIKDYLDRKRHAPFENWKRRFAQHELGTR